jgi:hypothetical protein
MGMMMLVHFHTFSFMHMSVHVLMFMIGGVVLMLMIVNVRLVIRMMGMYVRMAVAVCMSFIPMMVCMGMKIIVHVFFFSRFQNEHGLVGLPASACSTHNFILLVN